MSTLPEAVWVNSLKLQIKLANAGAPTLYGWNELAVRPDSLLTIIPTGGEVTEAGLFALCSRTDAESALAQSVETDGPPIGPQLWAFNLPHCDVRLQGVSTPSGKPATLELGFLNLRDALPDGRSLSLPIRLQAALARLFEQNLSARWRATARVLVRPWDPTALHAVLEATPGLAEHPLKNRMIGLVADPAAIMAMVMTRPDMLEQRLNSAVMFRDLPILALADDAFVRSDALRVALDRGWRAKPVEMTALATRNALVVDMLDRLAEFGSEIGPADPRLALTRSVVQRGAELLTDTKALSGSRSGTMLEAIEVRGSLVERPVEMMTANGPVLKGVIETRSGRMPFFAQGVSANTLKRLDPGDRIVALSRRLKIASQEYLKLEKVQVTSRYKDSGW